MLMPQPYESPWMTDDVKPVAELAQTFFAKEVVPNLDRFGENHQVDRELWNKAGDAGLLCTSWAKKSSSGSDKANPGLASWDDDSDLGAEAGEYHSCPVFQFPVPNSGDSNDDI